MAAHQASDFGYRNPAQTDTTEIHVLDNRLADQAQGFIDRLDSLQHIHQDIMVDMLPDDLLAESSPLDCRLCVGIPFFSIVTSNSSNLGNETITYQ